ncbi:AMP-binding protein [Rhodococcus rhodochrous]|uniref:AMP-binding protein n=1 Tax=Rhodococcus rhodochrous TaxID=1829 RepID=UPI001E396D56|nr:AMP-binding protein [Rhodococcus rhodochrous]
MTNTDALRGASALHPERTFVDFSGEQTSYEEFHRRAAQLANGLRGHGVKAGHTVATLLDNNLDQALAWFAINMAGAIAVPLNTALRGEFLRHQLSDSEAQVVISEGDYVDRLTSVTTGLPALRLVVHRGDLPPGLRLAGVTLTPIEHVRCGDDTDRGVQATPSDVSMLIYTSGTTGPSKACMISHSYAANLAGQVTAASTRRPDEVLWTPLPLFHLNAAAGSLLSTAMLQGSVSIARRFSLSGFWPEIERSGASMVSMLGVMVPLIAQMPDTPEMARCRGQLRIALGAPFPGELAEVWRDRFGVERAGAPGYGSTEAAMIVSAPLRPDPTPGASGRLNGDFDVRIFDEDDHEVPAGEVGEVVCRPLRPHVMFDGYWKRPEATLAVLGNQWFHTGDLGRFDGDGNFHFVDRKKDYLRRGSENISSTELEATFLLHPDVAEVAVHAVPSELSEDEVKVTVVRTAEGSVTEQELCAWSVDKVPYFAVPRYVEFRTSLPRNPVGRVLKFQLRDEGVTSGTWDRSSSDLVVDRR